ncbi:non-canonical purine NTP pyrophosphatase [Clostridiaceae bacterium M8S5]|nr:non-canonical purine NTP pyrophosphatase [Clostridiaceae bacterium M8S5]
MKKILFGTRNETRKEFVKEILNDIDVEILSLNDLDINIKIDESGNSPDENSMQKAVGYYKYSKITTFSIDAGLYIEAFPEHKQPGAFVRRINGIEVSDDEMLSYYVDELKKYGGKSRGVWKIALTLVKTPDEVFTATFERETFFTTEVCSTKSKGEPLNSIQINPKTGRYEAELTPEERKQSQIQLSKTIHDFILQHI